MFRVSKSKNNHQLQEKSWLVSDQREPQFNKSSIVESQLEKHAHY